MFYQSYHKTTSNKKNDEYNRIDTVESLHQPPFSSAPSQQQQPQSVLVAARSTGSFRPAAASGRYNLLPLKSLASIFNNQILSLAKFDGAAADESLDDDLMMVKSAAREVAAENEGDHPRRLDAGAGQELSSSSSAATDSNEDFMKFTEIFNYLSEEEDFEPSSSSSSSPSPTPSTSPLSSTFSLSLSASSSSMSSLRVKAKMDDQHILHMQMMQTHPEPAAHKTRTVTDEEAKSGGGDMDNVSIDSLPLSSALSSSLMSVNTISSSSSTSTPGGGEYSSSLPATSNLASSPPTMASFDDLATAKPDLAACSEEACQKSLSSSTPALSAPDVSHLSLTKPSPEFVVESAVLGLTSGVPKSKSIWSSALYLPCLHPALFELNTAHTMTCLSSIGVGAKQLNARKYDLTSQTPTPCLSWSCTFEANDFNPFSSKTSYEQSPPPPPHLMMMNAASGDLNLKFLNENRYALNNNVVDHNDFVNFKSLAQLRNNLNFINKYFQSSNYSQQQQQQQMNEFNRHQQQQQLHYQNYQQQQQHGMINEADQEFFNNNHELPTGAAYQADNSDFVMNSFGNNNFNRMNSSGSASLQNNGYNTNHSSYFNSNYRNNAFNRSSKRRYRNNNNNNNNNSGFGFGNQQYQSQNSAPAYSSQAQRNSLIIDDSSNFYGHSYESDSLPSSNRHSMVIGSSEAADFDVYKLKSNLNRNGGEEMGSLPVLTGGGDDSSYKMASEAHHHHLSANKLNEDSAQLTEYADSAAYNDFGKMSGRTMSNKFLAPRFEKKWMDQYQNGAGGFYGSQKDDASTSFSAGLKGRNHSFRAPNNSNNNNSMAFSGKFFTMPAKKNSNNFNYNSQYNLNTGNAGGNQQQQQQVMSTSLYSNGQATTTSSSSSTTSPTTSSPPTRHMLRRQNAIRLNHNQRYQHQNNSNNNYQFQSSNNSNQNAKSNPAASNNQPFNNSNQASCGSDCQQSCEYNSNRYHHHYNNSQQTGGPNSRYRPLGQGMTANNNNNNTAAATTNNKTCRC